MKKNHHKHKPKPKIKKHHIYWTAILSIVLTLIKIIVGHYETEKRLYPTDLTAQQTEDYIVSKVSTARISDRYTPVLLYRMVGDSVYFTGSGTSFVGKDNGTEIVTAEHVFGTNCPYGDTPFGARILRPLDPDIAVELISVIADSVTYGDRDIAVARAQDMTATPVKIHNFSSRGQGTNSIGTADHITLSSGRNIYRLQSLVSGKWYDIVGSEMIPGSTNTAIGVCLNCYSVPGESGTGFQDEEGSLYVLGNIQNTKLPTWRTLKADIGKIYHKKLMGVTTVYGPLKMK